MRAKPDMTDLVYKFVAKERFVVVLPSDNRLALLYESIRANSLAKTS